MSLPKGKKEWVIPDGYMSAISNGVYVSHEAICVLNTGDTDANIAITVYFEDREPQTGFKAVCKAKRTNHIRLDKLRDAEGNAIPRDVPYALEVESDYPVVVQHSRLDSTQSEAALMTTMGY